MKILFLDHDGVICLQSNWGSRFKKKKTDPFKAFDNFDKKAINALNKILEDTDTEIVISSDWKYYHELEEMKLYYKNQGIIKTPIGYTRRIEEIDTQNLPEAESHIIRITEIQDWLASHPQVTHWVAVDDIYMGNLAEAPQGRKNFYASRPDFNSLFLSNFVHTPRPTEGIKQLGKVDMIINFLQ
jgi:hypothetical protein